MIGVIAKLTIKPGTNGDFEATMKALQAKVSCPVVGWDERLTSAQAQRALRESGRNERQARKVIDQAAAQVLLQSWLDARTCG